MESLQVPTRRGKLRSRHNKKATTDNGELPVISVADIFYISDEVIVDECNDLTENDNIISDIIEEDYDFDDQDHVFEYTSRSNNHRVTKSRSSGGGCHNSATVIGQRHQLLSPHKWKHSVKKQTEIAANKTAGKQNIEKRLESKGLHRQGLAVFERAWCDKQSENKHGGYTNCKKQRSSGDSQSVLKHSLKKSDLKQVSSSHLLKIVDIQHRDITPEDYELLLQLDDSVIPKTVPQDVLNKLETATAPVLGCTGELCSICMEQFKLEDLLKKLLCGHYFHSPCVDRWLTFSSCACPLDGLPVV